jgi:hypothetical protein
VELPTQHDKGEEKAAGLEPPRYGAEEDNRRRGQGRATRRVIGWMATRIAARIARLLVTVKYYYLVRIIRIDVEEVERI